MESHSVLGSIFLNPTTAAGVAFGSGGTQLRKGPVYTERLLYARVNDKGRVEVDERGREKEGGAECLDPWSGLVVVGGDGGVEGRLSIVALATLRSSKG